MQNEWIIILIWFQRSFLFRTSFVVASNEFCVLDCQNISRCILKKSIRPFFKALCEFWYYSSHGELVERKNVYLVVDGSCKFNNLFFGWRCLERILLVNTFQLGLKNYLSIISAATKSAWSGSDPNEDTITWIDALTYATNSWTNTTMMIKKRSSFCFNDEEDDFWLLSLSTSISLLKISSSFCLKHNASIFDLILSHLKSSVPSQ